MINHSNNLCFVEVRLHFITYSYRQSKKSCDVNRTVLATPDLSFSYLASLSCRCAMHLVFSVTDCMYLPRHSYLVHAACSASYMLAV